MIFISFTFTEVKCTNETSMCGFKWISKDDINRVAKGTKRGIKKIKIKIKHLAFGDPSLIQFSTEALKTLKV